MAKLKARQTFDPDRGPILTVRFVLAVVLMVVGVAWVLYTGIKVDWPTDDNPLVKASGPKFMSDLANWNYVIGFGAFFLGLIVSAHPSTPLGRGRGVVVGMLGCFLIGLAWICVYYAIANRSGQPWVFQDLQQKNLIVGIVFMAVGFTFATRWE